MERRIAIIGAGVSGLVACKNCLKRGFNPIVFEADSKIGGVWNHTIESTRLQNVRQVYEFSDFPWDPSMDLHPTHYQIIDYFESYARHFRIFPCIRFNSKVIDIQYVGESTDQMESWDLWSGTGKPFDSKGKWHIKVQDTKNSQIKDYEFEFVILCLGQFSGLANIPEFAENVGPEVFKGKVMHSMEFSASNNMGSSKFVKGKRVAVIGSHKSAVDIAYECADLNGTKYKCTMVERTAHWFIPFGLLTGLLVGFLYMSRFAELMVHKPEETLLHSILVTLLSPLKWVITKFMECYIRLRFPLKKHGMLPKRSFDEELISCQVALLPDRFFEKVEEGSIVIKNSQSFKFYKDGLIIDVDGQSQKLEVDLVVFATGFKGEEKLKNMFSSTVFKDTINASSPPQLYRQIVHPRIPQLAIIGHNEVLSTLGTSEMKSLWLVNYFDGKIELPSIRDMEKEAKMMTDDIKDTTGRYYKRACLVKTNIWYHDKLCKDMGFNPKRKNGFLANLFIPYQPADYANLFTKE